MIMASLAEMIQATFTKDSQTPAIAFSCSFLDEKGTALSKLVSVCSTANSPAQIAAWCFQLQGEIVFLQQGELSLLVGRFFHVFHLQSTVSTACMEYVSVSPAVITLISFSFNSLILYTWSNE